MKTVKITFVKNGNSQEYKFATTQEANDFMRSKAHLAPEWKIELQ